MKTSGCVPYSKYEGDRTTQGNRARGVVREDPTGGPGGVWKEEEARKRDQRCSRLLRARPLFARACGHPPPPYLRYLVSQQTCKAVTVNCGLPGLPSQTPQSCAPLLLTSPNGSSFPLRGVGEVLKGQVPPEQLLTPLDALGDPAAMLTPCMLANQVGGKHC